MPVRKQGLYLLASVHIQIQTVSAKVWAERIYVRKLPFPSIYTLGTDKTENKWPAVCFEPSTSHAFVNLCFAKTGNRLIISVVSFHAARAEGRILPAENEMLMLSWAQIRKPKTLEGHFVCNVCSLVSILAWNMCHSGTNLLPVPIWVALHYRSNVTANLSPQGNWWKTTPFSKLTHCSSPASLSNSSGAVGVVIQQEFQRHGSNTALICIERTTGFLSVQVESYPYLEVQPACLFFHSLSDHVFSFVANSFTMWWLVQWITLILLSLSSIPFSTNLPFIPFTPHAQVWKNL